MMTLLNKCVSHRQYGTGVICEITEHIVWVRFPDPIGKKKFLYPDAFESFLRATNENAEKYVLKLLHAKKEQLELECEKQRKELEEHLAAAALERKKERSESSRKKSPRKKTGVS